MFKWFSSFLILFVVIGPVRLMAQTDTEFWFVVPEITWAHNTPGGVPANLRLSTMWLAASTIYGCVDTLKTNITVHPRLDASFVIDSASRCTPFFLPITPTAIGATTYQWIFGDGTANGNSSVPFQHQYDNPDPNNLVTYPLSLIVTNGGGACHDTLVRPVRVYPKVISKFIPDKVAGCNPLTVTFTNQSTGNATYVWDFGNSASSNVLNPTVVYEHGYASCVNLL